MVARLQLSPLSVLALAGRGEVEPPLDGLDHPRPPLILAPHGLDLLVAAVPVLHLRLQPLLPVLEGDQQREHLTERRG